MPTKSRKDARAVVRLVARYRSPTVFDFVDEECYDLSVGGMFIKSPSPAAAGTLLKLECDVYGRDQPIRGVARVVWVRGEDGAEGHAGMGVKFVKLEPGCAELIESIIDTVGEAGLNPEEEALRGSGVSAPPPEAPIARMSDRPSELAGAESAGPELAASQLASPEAASPGAESLGEAPPGLPEEPGESRAEDEEDEAFGEGPEGSAGPADTPSGEHAVSPPETVETAETAETANEASAPTGSATGEHASTEDRTLTTQGAPTGEPEPKPAGGAELAEPVTPTPTEESGNRGWLIGVAAAVALAAVFAIRGGGSPAEQPTLPQRAAEHATAPAPSQALTAQPAKSNDGTDTPAHTPEVSKPAPEADAPEADAPEADAPEADAPEADPQGGTDSDVTNEGEPGDEQTATSRAPSVDGDYVLEIITRPSGAVVTVGEQQVVAPGELNLGKLSEPVRVEANKRGHRPTAATVEPAMFEAAEGKMHKRIYLSLKPED